MGKAKHKRLSIQAKKRKLRKEQEEARKNPIFLNERSAEWENRPKYAIGYTVPEGTTPEQELLWVNTLKKAYFEAMKSESPPPLPTPPKKKKKKRKFKVERYKVKISLIGTEL